MPWCMARGVGKVSEVCGRGSGSDSPDKPRPTDLLSNKWRGEARFLLTFHSLALVYFIFSFLLSGGCPRAVVLTPMHGWVSRHPSPVSPGVIIFSISSITCRPGIFFPVSITLSVILFTFLAGRP